ncbi:glycosyltransferase [Patescibacteria group bacterium]|nr:glycosyltransferase [Patescibacteria group bacterium]
MKIGFLTPSIYMYEKRYSERIFAPGPLARHIVTGLKRRGHDVFWFSAPEETDVQLTPGDRILLEDDLKIRVFQDLTNRDKTSLFATKMYYESDLLTRAYTEARKEGITVMHDFQSFGHLSHFYEEESGIPTLYTLHDPVPTPDMLEYWIFKRFPTHRFLSISKHQQEGELKQYFFDTVYNGIDVDRFAYNPEGGDCFITSGRMQPVKGHDAAIAAVKAAGQKLRMATWLNDTIKASTYYVEKIAPVVDGNDIQINSLMSGDDLVRFYQHARALLFPIQWAEPFGMVMIEAMSCGTPVIAYNRGSVPEVVKDGVTGFIIDPDDTDYPGKGSWVIRKQGIDGFVEAIRRIGEIDRAQCRRHVEENFSIERMVEGYERVYQRV